MKTNNSNKNNVKNNKGNWRFCNAELVPYPHPWSHDSYKCPECGSTSGMVNALGRCSTKIYS